MGNEEMLDLMAIVAMHAMVERDGADGDTARKAYELARAMIEARQGVGSKEGE